MIYCTKCGNKLDPGVKFCTRCGDPVRVAIAVPEAQDIPEKSPAPGAVPFPEGTLSSEAGVPPTAAPEPNATEMPPLAPAASEWQSLSPAAATQPAAPATPPVANTKSGCLPAILIALAVLAVLAVLVIGGVVYVGYKVKQKATEAPHKAIPATQTIPSPGGAKPGEQVKGQSDDGSGVIGGLSNLLGGDDDGDLVQSISDKDPVDPCVPAQFPPQTVAKIPLKAGTVLTTAWGIAPGDVESRIQLDSATDNSISMNESTEAYVDDDGNKVVAEQMRAFVCNADLVSADTQAGRLDATAGHPNGA